LDVIWPGEPGKEYANDSDKIVYQFVCSWVNTCGACAQYHLAVSKWWPKMHRGCNCQSRPIYPGEKSAPYEDWKKIVADLPPDQQKALVGAANYKLIEQGVVAWEDVVTTSRVRLLREVVSRKNLTVDQMTTAGVSERIAKSSYESVNTPEHQLIAQTRADLVNQIQALGIQPQHLSEMFGERMAQRAGIGGGPSGAGWMPTAENFRSIEDWVTVLLAGYRSGKMADLGTEAATLPGMIAKAGEEMGVEFKPQENADSDEYVTIVVSVAKVDAVLALDKDMYVGPGGENGIEGRYQNVKDQLSKSRDGGEPFEQPRGGLTTDGVITIEDGRHRWAVLRDEGADGVPISVPRDQVDQIRRLYGVNLFDQ
jgi:hypothetical protein